MDTLGPILTNTNAVTFVYKITDSTAEFKFRFYWFLHSCLRRRPGFFVAKFPETNCTSVEKIDLDPGQVSYVLNFL